ncbi:MAG: hypothetical protein JO218_08505, partial [Burkholderiales bacterium]|nr:hypothetical protein [Burkholderiales bacterium]
IILVMVAQIALPMMHYEHNLYTFAGMPDAPYSDMNGYGHFLPGRLWFAFYWLLFCIAALIKAQAFWVRGIAPSWGARVQGAVRQLRGPSGIALAGFGLAWIGCGAWIYYNTNVLNDYVPSDVAMDRQANYEKQFRKYKGLPQPRITDIRANVDIYPERRAVDLSGHYRLVNKTGAPIDTLYVQMDPQYPAILSNLPAYKTELADKDSGFHILKLVQPLAAGAAIDMDFKVEVRNPGFTNTSGVSGFGGNALNVNYNGTFFNNQNYFPHLGYQSNAELPDRNERRKRGLGEPMRMAKLEDERARSNNDISNDADWISYETTVSTSADQTAVAPGYLQESWEKGGRRYFHYKMDRPMLSFFSYLSADWQIKKSEWHGLPIQVYYDAKHGYNVDRMIEATQKALDYYTANFGPYQHKQVRILEFPRYASFAQSFANTIPFSEDIGFIADLRNKDDIDYVYYVTAHEVAHQWWGHQVIGADVQGGSMLMESMAQYSAMMVMEKTYGREHMRRFLRFELDGYLRGRGGERIEEQPLYRVESQDYIHYRKGALVFYRLRDEIGEAPLNRALKRFVQDKAYQNAPYTTSKEMLDYIRAETPADKQQLVTDLFEKIVFYDNRVVEANAVKRKDGKWDVTMKLHLRKYETDGQGKESSRSYDEPVEIGVFAKAADGKEDHEKVLMLDKRKLTGEEPTVTVTVAEEPYEVGVDPFNILIDRVPSDNRKTVTVEQSRM